MDQAALATTAEPSAIINAVTQVTRFVRTPTSARQHCQVGHAEAGRSMASARVMSRSTVGVPYRPTLGPRPVATALFLHEIHDVMEH